MHLYAHSYGGPLRSAADPAAYSTALMEFMGRFVFPGPPPEPMMRAQQHSGAEVYERMHGASWFSPDGQWSAWDATPRLGEIRAPTLVVGGTRDQCVPELAETLAAAIPGAQLVILDAAHLPFFESPDEYLALVGDFLARAETPKHNPGPGARSGDA